MRPPSGSWMRLKWRSCSSIALYMRTGTLTRPNEIAPVHSERGMHLQRSARGCSFGTEWLHMRRARRRTVVGMKNAATPWGNAAVVEELRLPQQSGDKRFATVVQLLETPKGERLVRFAYSTDGTSRRGPVTLR